MSLMHKILFVDRMIFFFAKDDKISRDFKIMSQVRYPLDEFHVSLSLCGDDHHE